MDIRKAAQIITFFICTFASAQNIQLHIGKNPKVVSETEWANKRVYLYNYIEGSKDYGLYWQAIAEPTIYKAISLHTEVRTDLNNYTEIVGLALGKVKENWLINGQILYRHEDKADFQMSSVFMYKHKRFCLNGFVDVWNMKDINLYSEIKAFYSICEHFSLGMISNIDLHKIKPYIGIKVDL